jgi:hypothetical protein
MVSTAAMLWTALDLLVTKGTSITGGVIDENDCVVVARPDPKPTLAFGALRHGIPLPVCWS